MKKGQMSFEISGNVVDIISGTLIPGTIKIEDGIISEIRKGVVSADHYLLPGLIDAHIHIESSMLIPSEFARLAVVHGTVATVSDPHEIANVLGVPGIRFMIENGKKVPFKFYFGAPSCVPATGFETSGAVIGPEELEDLLASDDIFYLSEMMNFPGVLYKDPVVIQKLAMAMKYGKPVDGHAPGLSGEKVREYISAGISTDHECFSMDEALEKVKYGMKILIREGSAAKNFNELIPLLNLYPDSVMFCSDDKHPDDLVKGHINELVKRAISMGFDPVKVLRCCTLNPVKHYRLNTGLLRTGDTADFIIVDDLKNFNILQTGIDGKLVARNGRSLIGSVRESKVNHFIASPLMQDDIRVPAEQGEIRVIKAQDGQLITKEVFILPIVENGNVVSEPERDILKLVIKNRYTDAPPAIGFVTGFGFRNGAIASSIAHDSHNIIAIGADDNSIIKAINLVINAEGGISVVTDGRSEVLPLPFAGIMSGNDGYVVAKSYKTFNALAKEMGSHLMAPYMTLSFMALLVIPDLKLSDKGLFNGKEFQFTNLFKNK